MTERQPVNTTIREKRHTVSSAFRELNRDGSTLIPNEGKMKHYSGSALAPRPLSEQDFIALR
jgi:hypothetical protein